MGKKGRKSAKTGDKAINKQFAKDNDDDKYRRSSKGNISNNNNNDDDMYDTTDRWHKMQDDDFIKLDGAESSESESEEAVMKLNVPDSDDESSNSNNNDENGNAYDFDDASNDDNNDSENENVVPTSDDSSDDDNDKNNADENVRDWGRRKASYYHGDTADLEIGQDQDEALEEEEAAKELQKTRYREMAEVDFVLSDNDDDVAPDSDNEDTQLLNKPPRDMSKLSIPEQQKIIDRQHPEMLPLMAYFGSVFKDLTERSDVAVNALFQDGKAVEDVGSTILGQQYLLTKAMLQSSAALNFVTYLLLKADLAQQTETDPSIIQSHPVLASLQTINKHMQRLEDSVEKKVKTLPHQLDNLVKAASLIASGNDDLSDVDEVNDEQQLPEEVVEESDSDDESAGEAAVESDVEDIVDLDDIKLAPTKESKFNPELEHSVLNEARFGLRQNEVHEESAKSKRKRRPMPVDFGDGVNDEADENVATKALSATLNTLEQRLSAKKQKSAKPLMENIDDIDDPDGELKRGLDMMEAELGRMSDEDDDAENGGFGEDYGEDGDGNDFYSQVKQKSKAKKEIKKAMYAVPPKFPRGEALVEGERAISKVIMKNRGLVAHKPKINRNPRVKKREQYRKALIRRRGAVRDVRTDEGHVYGGEATGVKSNISRSRKLAR